MRIVHVITGLGFGGAETDLLRLLETPELQQHQNRVVSLLGEGELSDKVRESGAEVENLNLSALNFFPYGAWRLRRMIQSWQPDVVQSIMYHADFLASFAVGKIPLVWGIKHCNVDGSQNKIGTRLIARTCACLAGHFPRAIVSNSHAGAKAHIAIGYPEKRIRVISNGFNTQRYVPNRAVRQAVRKQLGITPEQPLIGYVARFHPVKDHLNLIKAASRLKAKHPDTRFVLIGRGVDDTNETLTGWLNEHKVRDRFLLLGPQSAVERYIVAFDVATLTSFSEGLPNVLGEAMACGVPCVSTDVGDAARVIDRYGVVVPTGDPQALANGWATMLEMPSEQRQTLGLEAREHIIRNYSQEKIAHQYCELYREIVQGNKG